MARLPALLELLGGAFGRSPSAMDGLARELRGAGQLPETKRGVGAAHVGDIDAAAFLLALATSESPKAGAEGARIYSTLTPRHTPDRAAFDGTVIGEAGKLRLGNAVAFLLTHSRHLRSELPETSIRLVVERPGPVVKLYASPPGDVEQMAALWMPDMSKFVVGFYNSEADPSKPITSVSIPGSTIYAVSDLILSV